MKWYTLKVGMLLNEGMTAYEIDMMLYKVLKHSGLSYGVEEILGVEDYDETNGEE